MLEGFDIAAAFTLILFVLAMKDPIFKKLR